MSRTRGAVEWNGISIRVPPTLEEITTGLAAVDKKARAEAWSDGYDAGISDEKNGYERPNPHTKSAPSDKEKAE